MKQECSKEYPFFFYKVENGFILQDPRNKNFIFKDVDELCKFIKDHYFEMPKRIEEL